MASNVEEDYDSDTELVPDYDMVIVARWIDSSKIGDFVRKVIQAHK